MIPVDTLLAWGATYKKVAAEEIIFKEGTEAHFYFQLISGSVRWVNITDTGREFIQDIIEQGESFGELPLFDDLPYAASAIASQESLLLRLQKNNFRQLLKQEPETFMAFNKLLTERIRFKFKLLKELSCKGPEERIVSLLSHFKESHKYICKRCCRLLLTRQQIADMTGLRVETVIRAVKHLQQQGALVIEKGKIFY